MTPLRTRWSVARRRLAAGASAAALGLLAVPALAGANAITSENWSGYAALRLLGRDRGLLAEL
jgi:hypothetical protein